MSYSLIINNLEISVKSLIGYKKIVSDFNLTLHPGRKLGIVGESGSGKTLSMLALNRLLPSQIEVTGGSIFFNNKNLNNMEKKEFYREFLFRRKNHFHFYFQKLTLEGYFLDLVNMKKSYHH